MKIAQGNTVVNVKVDAMSAADVTRDILAGFVEDDRFVSIEPEHYTGKTDMGDLKWIRVQDYGRTLSAMRGQGPADFGPLQPGKDSPHLEYKTYFFTSGEASVYSILAPNLAFIPGRDLRFRRLYRRSEAHHGHGCAHDSNRLRHTIGQKPMGKER